MGLLWQNFGDYHKADVLNGFLSVFIYVKKQGRIRYYLIGLESHNFEHKDNKKYYALQDAQDAVDHQIFDFLAILSRRIRDYVQDARNDRNIKIHNSNVPDREYRRSIIVED